jgi:hypothetical protein
MSISAVLMDYAYSRSVVSSASVFAPFTCNLGISACARLSYAVVDFDTAMNAIAAAIAVLVEHRGLRSRTIAA